MDINDFCKAYMLLKHKYQKGDIKGDPKDIVSALIAGVYYETRKHNHVQNKGDFSNKTTHKYIKNKGA